MIQDAELTRIIPISTFQAHKDYLTRVLLSPDVKHLATCSADHTAKVWNLDQDYRPARATLAAAAAATAAASTKNQSITGTENGKTTSGSGSGSGSASSSSHSDDPENKDIDERNQVLNIFNIGDSHHSTASSSESKHPTFPAQPGGPPINPATATLFLETTLANHQRWVWDCAFSADSAYLVTVSSDHYARLWELASGQIIRQYSGHHRGAVCVALNDYSEPR